LIQRWVLELESHIQYFMFHPILAPSLLLLAIDLQILPTFCSDSSNLMDDELHICTTTQSH
jgi:hypothetical protein